MLNFSLVFLVLAFPSLINGIAEGNALRYSKNNNNNRNLIVGGIKTIQGRYPYFVSIEGYCGGSLIAPDIVLAAGHCKKSYHSYNREGLYVRIGLWSEKDDKDSYQIRQVIQQIRHPDFERRGDDNFNNDFVILQLNNATDDNIPILKLNNNNEIPVLQQELTAMGMGWTKPDYESKSNTLRQTTLNAIDNELCATSHDEDVTYEDQISDSMICTTGGEHNERDACAYDSGSPIIIAGETPEDDIQVALVSWGEGCADEVFPGVHARVSYAYEWIQNTVCEISSQPPNYMCGPPTATTPEVEPSSSSQTHVPLHFYIFIFAAVIFILVLLVAVVHFCKSHFTNIKTTRREEYSKLDNIDDAASIATYESSSGGTPKSHIFLSRKDSTYSYDSIGGVEINNNNNNSIIV